MVFWEINTNGKIPFFEDGFLQVLKLHKKKCDNPENRPSPSSIKETTDSMLVQNISDNVAALTTTPGSNQIALPDHKAVSETSKSSGMYQVWQY